MLLHGISCMIPLLTKLLQSSKIIQAHIEVTVQLMCSTKIYIGSILSEILSQIKKFVLFCRHSLTIFWAELSKNKKGKYGDRDNNSASLLHYVDFIIHV